MSKETWWLVVSDCRARLHLYRETDTEMVLMRTIEDVPEELVEEALEAQGGAINLSGWYTITPKLEDWLEEYEDEEERHEDKNI